MRGSRQRGDRRLRVWNLRHQIGVADALSDLPYCETDTFMGDCAHGNGAHRRWARGVT
jgi:hypothetical protein